MQAIDGIRTAAAGLDHPEAVTVSPDGTVWAGGEAGQVYRVDLESATVEQVADAGGFLLGITADGDGLLYVCNIGTPLVQRVDPVTGSVVTYTAGTPEWPLTNPNLGVFDEAGNLYVTESGKLDADNGCVMRVSPDGLTTVWTEESRAFPNGACLAADGNSLIVVESATPGLARIPILPDGSAGRREVLAVLDGTVPDGVAAAADGSLWVFCYRPDRVLRVDPEGSVSIVADDPRGTTLAAPTGGVWTGPDRRTLLVANLGRWHIAAWETEVPGVPLRYPRLPQVSR